MREETDTTTLPALPQEGWERAEWVTPQERRLMGHHVPRRHEWGIVYAHWAYRDPVSLRCCHVTIPVTIPISDEFAEFTGFDVPAWLDAQARQRVRHLLEQSQGS